MQCTIINMSSVWKHQNLKTGSLIIGANRRGCKVRRRKLQKIILSNLPTLLRKTIKSKEVRCTEECWKSHLGQKLRLESNILITPYSFHFLKLANSLLKQNLQQSNKRAKKKFPTYWLFQNVGQFLISTNWEIYHLIYLFLKNNIDDRGFESLDVKL